MMHHYGVYYLQMFRMDFIHYALWQPYQRQSNFKEAPNHPISTFTFAESLQSNGISTD